MSYLYVTVQIVIILLIGYQSRVPGNAFLLAGAVFGVLLMVWALAAMRMSNLNIMPDVSEESVLVTSGPYRFLRHPMYGAVLLVTLVLVIDYFSWLRAGYWVILCIDLNCKLLYEEKLMVQKHPGYSEYMKKTKRFVPLVY